MTKATVTKTGNSYALRVPKSYIEDNHLKLGDIVNLEDPLTKQNSALGTILLRAKTNGPIKGISNPVKWQREQRVSTSPWEKTK